MTKNIKILRKQITNNKLFNNIIAYCKYHYDKEATEYYKKMLHLNKHLIEIQNEIVIELKTIIHDVMLFDVSNSITSCMNIEDSDIDINISIESIDINSIEKLGYTFKSIYNRGKRYEYTIYTKYYKNIEIELKLRDFKKIKNVLAAHHYLDDNQRNKKYITFMKKLFHRHKNLYYKYKMCIYNNALYNLHILDFL